MTFMLDGDRMKEIRTGFNPRNRDFAMVLGQQIKQPLEQNIEIY